MPTEQIVLEIEERPAVEAARRANRELEKYEQSAVRAAQSASRAWQGSGETMVRVSDRSRGSIERMVRAVETRAALAGKTGVERLAAERDLLIGKLAGEERAMERARAAYDRLIAAQREGTAAASAHAGSLGALVQHLAGAYLSFEGLRRVIEVTAVETAKQAARYNTLGVALQATAQANDLSVRMMRQQEEAMVKLGITGTMARQGMMRMATAQIDLSKATQLARLAQNAAVIAAINSSEAFDHLIYGIQSGQVRVLRTIGINVDFQESYERLAKQLGKTTLELTDYEKVQARTNEVLRVAPRFAGIYEAAMTDVGKRMTSLRRYFEEAEVAVGQKFQPALRLVVDTLTELLKLIEHHPEIGAALAVAATGGLAALGARILGGAGAAKVVGGVGAVAAAGAAASGMVPWWSPRLVLPSREFPYGALETEAGVKAWQAAQDLPGIAAAARAEGMRETMAHVRRSVEGQALKIRMEAWQKYFDALQTEEALKKRISQVDQEANAAAAAYDIAGYERALKKKTALEAQLKALEDQKRAREFLKDLESAANVRELEYLRTTQGWVERLRGVKLTAAQEEQAALQVNRILMAEYHKEAEGLAETWRKLTLESAKYFAQQAEERSAEALKRAKEVGDRYLESAQRIQDLETESQRATIEHQARLEEVQARALGGPGAEAAGIERRYEVRLRLAERLRDFERERAAREADTFKRAEILARAQAEFERASQQAEIDHLEHLQDLEMRRFRELKQTAEGVFDALLTRSESLSRAILNIFKTAILTPIKDFFSSAIARLLMPLYGLRTAPSGGGALGVLGGVLGGAALPAFGGATGIGFPGAPGGTGGLAGTVWPSGATPASGAAWGANFAGFLPGLKSFLGIGGSIPTGAGLATTWQAATLGQKLSSLGRSDAAALGGGLLALAGLRRGGVSGLAMTTAGGALIGFRYGGPLGAAMGAGAGAVAGLVRLFVNSASEKAREKIRAVYGIDISDKGVLKQIVETARQAFGGNLDMAIRSQQIRDLIELYALSTGQSVAGLPATMRPVSLVQQGGSLYQQNLGMGAAPSLDRIGVARPQNAGLGPVVIKLDGPATVALLRGEAVQAMAENPRAVQAASLAATRANAGRRELLSLQVSPGTLVS